MKKKMLRLRLAEKESETTMLFCLKMRRSISRGLWTAAYADTGVPKGTRLFYQACRGLLSAIRGSVDALNRPPLRPGRRRAATLRNDYTVAPLRELACSLCRINVSIVRGQKPRKTFSEVVRMPGPRWRAKWCAKARLSDIGTPLRWQTTFWVRLRRR